MADSAPALAFHPDNTVDTSNIKFPSTIPKQDASRKMVACCWQGDMKLKTDTVPVPLVTDPADAVIRITASTVCGSDLHLYHNEMADIGKDSIFGHEGVGIIDSVGPEVRTFKPGDRVAVSAIVSCGSCDYCRKQQFSLCDTTNPSKLMEKLYGHRTGGLLGYGGLLGGYPGCQAEYVRVPLADINLLKLSPNLTDAQGILLSDIVCTAWHANELVNVGPGDTVCVWGLGPVGQLACYLARFRGASRVIGIDCIPERLALAKNKAQCDDTINFQQEEVVKRVQTLLPGGPDVCIDASAFRYASNILHKVERAVRLETDTCEVVNQCITCCKKGGRISLIADYYGYTNHFNIGALMEKSILMRGGQVFVQKYWHHLQGLLSQGRLQLDWIFSHTFPLTELSKAYDQFDRKERGIMKIILTTSHTGTGSSVPGNVGQQMGGGGGNRL